MEFHEMLKSMQLHSHKQMDEICEYKKTEGKSGIRISVKSGEYLFSTLEEAYSFALHIYMCHKAGEAADILNAVLGICPGVKGDIQFMELLKSAKELNLIRKETSSNDSSKE